MSSSMATTSERRDSILAYTLAPQNKGKSRRQVARELGIHESLVRRSIACKPTGDPMTSKTKIKPKLKARSNPGPKLINIDPRSLVLDQGIQPRAATNEKAIGDYTKRYAEKEDLGTVTVFRDSDENVDRVADGFHRIPAAIAADLKTVPCNVYMGNRLDCLTYALGANVGHVGIRYSTADKRRAIGLALADPDLSGRTDAVIAEICGVSSKTVATQREQSGSGNSRTGDDEKRVGKDGKTYPAARPAKANSATGDSRLGVADDPTTPQPEGPEAELDGRPDVQVETPSAARDDEGVASAGSSETSQVQGDVIATDEAADTESRAASEVKPATGPSDFDPRVESDGEWLADFKVRGDLSLRCKAIFDADAILWRKMTAHESMVKFVNVLAHHLPPSETRGAYGASLDYITRIKGPDHWMTCSSCHGQGHGETATPCRPCNGRGYKTST